MIKAKMHRDSEGHIVGFNVENHGDPIVCSAVSILVQNTINSIECFTGAVFSCTSDQKSGTLHFKLTDVQEHDAHDVALLLNSFLLGLQGIESEYGKHLRITDSH